MLTYIRYGLSYEATISTSIELSHFTGIAANSSEIFIFTHLQCVSALTILLVKDGINRSMYFICLELITMNLIRVWMLIVSKPFNLEVKCQKRWEEEL